MVQLSAYQRCARRRPLPYVLFVCLFGTQELEGSDLGSLEAYTEELSAMGIHDNPYAPYDISDIRSMVRLACRHPSQHAHPSMRMPGQHAQMTPHARCPAGGATAPLRPFGRLCFPPPRAPPRPPSLPASTARPLIRSLASFFVPSPAPSLRRPPALSSPSGFPRLPPGQVATELAQLVEERGENIEEERQKQQDFEDMRTSFVASTAECERLIKAAADELGSLYAKSMRKAKVCSSTPRQAAPSPGVGHPARSLPRSGALGRAGTGPARCLLALVCCAAFGRVSNPAAPIETTFPGS